MVGFWWFLGFDLLDEVLKAEGIRTLESTGWVSWSATSDPLGTATNSGKIVWLTFKNWDQRSQHGGDAEDLTSQDQYDQYIQSENSMLQCYCRLGNQTEPTLYPWGASNICWKGGHCTLIYWSFAVEFAAMLIPCQPFRNVFAVTC